MWERERAIERETEKAARHSKQLERNEHRVCILQWFWTAIFHFRSITYSSASFVHDFASDKHTILFFPLFHMAWLTHLFATLIFFSSLLLLFHFIRLFFVWQNYCRYVPIVSLKHTMANMRWKLVRCLPNATKRNICFNCVALTEMINVCASNRETKHNPWSLTGLWIQRARKRAGERAREGEKNVEQNVANQHSSYAALPRCICFQLQSII